MYDTDTGQLISAGESGAGAAGGGTVRRKVKGVCFWERDNERIIFAVCSATKCIFVFNQLRAFPLMLVEQTFSLARRRPCKAPPWHPVVTCMWHQPRPLFPLLLHRNHDQALLYRFVLSCCLFICCKKRFVAFK